MRARKTFPALLLVLFLFFPSASQAVGLIPAGWGPLINYGGPVLKEHRVHLLWWSDGRSWPAGYREHIQNYFQDVAQDSGKGSNIYGVLREYGIPYQVGYGGSVDINTSYPATSLCPKIVPRPCLYESQMADRLRQIINQRKADGWQKGLRDAYFVFTPPGVSVCTIHWGCRTDAEIDIPGGGMGADHEMTSDGIVWAMMPYPKEKSYSQPFSPINQETIDLSHEHMEMITDPAAPPKGGFGGAWMTHTPDFAEITDICNGLAPAGFPRQRIAGRYYRVSGQWSNRRGMCAYSDTTSYPWPRIKAPRTIKRGQWVVLDASSSRGSSRLSWQWSTGGREVPFAWQPGRTVVSRSARWRVRPKRKGTLVVDLKVSDSLGRSSYRTLRIPVR